jgi:hypothetical protein
MSAEEYTGALKDPEDERDYSAGAIYEAMGVARNAYPSILDLRVRLPKVKNQGSRGTCAAHAATALKEWQENTDSGYTGRFSPEFVYFYRENKPNSGMFSRDVMKILATRGCCTESDLPYSETDDGAPAEVPSDVEQRASQYVISEYARVNTIEELKTALYQNGPCYIAFPTYKTRPEFWRRKTPDEARVGGHAVAVVGYTESGFILRNSWGKSWNGLTRNQEVVGVFPKGKSATITREGNGLTRNQEVVGVFPLGKSATIGDGHVLYPYSDFGAHWDIWTAIDSRGSPKPPPEKSSSCCTLM